MHHVCYCLPHRGHDLAREPMNGTRKCPFASKHTFPPSNALWFTVERITNTDTMHRYELGAILTPKKIIIISGGLFQQRSPTSCEKAVRSEVSIINDRLRLQKVVTTTLSHLLCCVWTFFSVYLSKYSIMASLSGLISLDRTGT
jgi:hypothetical protein